MNQDPGHQAGSKNSCPYMNGEGEEKDESEGNHHKHMNCFQDEMDDQDTDSVNSDISGEGEKTIVKYECLSGCCDGSGGGNGFTHGQSKHECDHSERFGCGVTVGPVACNGGCCPAIVPQMSQTTTHISSHP